MTPRLLILAGLAIAGITSLHAAETLKLDPQASKVTFSIMNKPPNGSEFSKVEGTFKEFGGTILLDESDPTKSSIEVEIQTASVDTANAKRDDHLRNQDFFKVKEFPAMTFKSTSVKSAGDGAYEITGDFTMLGKTREITVTAKKTGDREATTSFRILRSDHGMSYRIPETADEVDVTLQLVAAK